MNTTLKFITFLIILNIQTINAKDVVDITDSCSINWTTGIIICSGESEEGQSKFKAKRAATIIAQRNLLEVVKGIQIDSETTVKKGMDESSIIRSSVQGVVKGAEVVETRYNKKTQSAISKIKLRMGEDLLKALLSDPVKFSWNSTIEMIFSVFSTNLYANEVVPLSGKTYSNSSFGNEDKKTLLKLKKEIEKNDMNINFIQYIDRILNQISSQKQYTGVLVDASEIVDFKKAMLVKFVNNQGEELYPSDLVPKRLLIKNNGSVSYDLDRNDAINNQKISTAPLVIKPLSVYKNRKSDLVLNDIDIKQLNNISDPVLKQAKIIILIGD